MNLWKFFLVLIGANSFSGYQYERDIVIIMVKNDRVELAKTLRLLNTSHPKMIALNLDLDECDSVTEFPTSHGDNGEISTEMIQSKSESQLLQELSASLDLLMPSRLQPFSKRDSGEVIGCPFLYPKMTSIGFVNLIYNIRDSNQVGKFKISNKYGQDLSYHFAVKIALKLNKKSATGFIESHPNVLPINDGHSRKFKTFNIQDFYDNKENIKFLKDKIVIIGTGRPNDYRIVPGKKKLLTTSEIFANIACQMVE
ncbi:MAG: CHASE2 domain-containing protein [Bacteroidota bacterium]